MGAVFEITLDISTTENKKKLDQAINEIIVLSRNLSSCKSEKIQSFLKDMLEPEESWLTVKDDSVIIMAEKEVVISRSNSNAKKAKKISYTFGKVYPAPAEYLLAVIAIFYHHIPSAIIDRDIVDHELFDDGVMLARTVNSNVNNPFSKSSTISPSKEMQVICSELGNVSTVSSGVKSEQKLETPKNVLRLC